MIEDSLPETISGAPKALEFSAPSGRVIRQLKDGDTRELFEFLSDNRKNFAEFASELNVVQNEDQALQMINNRAFATFGVKNPEDDRLAALVTVAQESEDTVSLGFAVGERYRRQGYASDSVRSLAEYLFKRHDIKKIRCSVKPGNRASRKLLENCGFHLQGERPSMYVFYELDKNPEQTGQNT
jgi:RimJ/RimL family protein N-acetyltransferase